jgi:general secretion pathway protein A
VYREFYGLEEKPFALLPDPRFMYLSASHQEALAHLLYGIESGEGFIKLVGQVGTGKTTLCRTLLDRLGPNVNIAFIFNPSQTELELLQSVHREFGLSPERKGRAELVEELNEFLLKARAEGRRVVLLIDEAQNLPRDVLEQLRLLSNLETEREKLLQIVLIAQPELERQLARADLRQLRQRITVGWEIRALSCAETVEYVNHRLRVAGRRRGPALFTRSGLHALHRASKGTPRLINAIADRALLAGYALGKTQIHGRIVTRAVREMVGPSSRSSPWPRLAAALAAAAALLALLFWVALQRSWIALPGGAGPGEAEATAQSLPAPQTQAVAAALPAAPPIGSPQPVPGSPGFTAVAEAELLRLGPALLERSAAGSAAEALGQVLGLWGIKAADLPQSVEPTQMAAVLRKATNLRLNLDFTTLAELRALDQPVILELEPRAGELRYAVLQTLIEGELAGVAAGEQLFVLSTGALQRFWNGRAFFVWRNFESWPAQESAGARGSVRGLQAALTRLGYLKPGDPSGEYDPLTEAAVRRFQQRGGIAATGELGFKTMIALYHALDERALKAQKRALYGGPRLARRPAARGTT